MAQCTWCGAELAPPYRFCPRCGQPAADASESSPVPSAPERGPVRADRDSGILLVVVTALIVVGVSLAFAGILYLTTAGLSPPPPSPTNSKPVMTLMLNSESSVGADILVNGVQPATSPSNLKVNLEVNASFGTATSLGASGSAVYVFVAGGTYTVTWENPGGSGNVVGGDHFVVLYPAGSGAPSVGTTLALIIIWSDGSTVATVSWQV